MLKIFLDFKQLLPDTFETVQHPRLIDHILLLSLESFCRALYGEALDLQQELDMLECLYILLHKKSVTFGIPLRLDEL